ncbi:hypothetical protein NL676_035741 [Syzygium grande]|nr:hypothetical protein NL676_035741 [Syzygium grande]
MCSGRGPWQSRCPEHMSGSGKGCSFSYAFASSYARPSAECRAPPVPPSYAPRERDIRKRRAARLLGVPFHQKSMVGISK